MGETVFGCAIQFYRSAERAFAAAGFDYVCTDTEHGGADLALAGTLMHHYSKCGQSSYIADCLGTCRGTDRSFIPCPSVEENF